MGSGYFPSVLDLVQLSSVAVPLAYATLLLYLSLLTLTAGSRCGGFVRLILLPPTIYFFWKACSLYHLFASCFTATGVATVGCYGCLLALQFTLLQPWDAEKPRWISTRKERGQIVIVYHDPENFPERLFYAFDLLCSLRGTSWISNREWNWNHPRQRIATTLRIHRRDFLANCFKRIIQLVILLDVFDIVCKSRAWDLDSQTPNPLYVIPIWQQFIFAIALCINTSITLEIHYTVISGLAVLLGSDTVSWPSLFNSPFRATSISDFWANRWHWLFRRIFTQISAPVVRSVQRLSQSERSLLVTLTRTFGAFGVSAILHLFIMYHAECWAVLNLGDGVIDRVTFLDIDVLSFFMAQPFGIIFEKSILETIIIDRLFPSTNDGEATDCSIHVQAQAKTKPLARREKLFIMRVFTWTFLAWTGRWWTNKWIRSGFFAADAKTVPLSLIRSLWYRKIVS